MDKILSQSKSYEYIRDRADPAYEDMVRAIEIVKKFIIDNELILYGGSAIDFALRLHGDKIYSDDTLAIPDLDFYSPDSVEHSYQLADILFAKGFKSVRVVRAMYVRTMKIDIMDNHWVADITFCPPDIFKKLPTITYNQMRVIHPDYQRVDLHSSLSFPYDNPPTEVIFDRWKKDIERFNLLNKYYPIENNGQTLPLKQASVQINSKHTLTGFAAYGIIAAHFEDLTRNLKLKHIPTIARAASIVDGHLQFDTFDQTLDFVHFDVDKLATDLRLTSADRFDPLVSLIPELISGRMGDLNVRIYSTKNRLITVNTVKIGDTPVKIVNIQPLLRHFIALANSSEGKLRNTYLSIYSSLLDMIRIIEEKVVDKSFGVLSDELIETLKGSPLFPSTYTYGNENNSLAYLVLLNHLLHDLGEAQQYTLPWNYYPEKSLAKGIPHPVFDYNSSEFYRESGTLTHKNISFSEKNI